MSRRPSRYRTGDPALDQRISEMLDAAGAVANRDQLAEILVSGVRLATDDADRLDLKITNSALKEMRQAFNMFAPYRDVPKVTIFGSARTLPDDPLYHQTAEIARSLSGEGWMVVTGAGPGIMAAGMEGAGRENAIGVLISLPFEGGANEVIAGDDKLIEMKYFFTRKLMLVKESRGFVCLPGGFGTLDETFELLTLTQTGKMEPVPIVLLDTPHGSYWDDWHRFVTAELEANRLISPDDSALYLVTDSVEEACAEVVGFYRNYHSIRWVGDTLVMRLRARPDDDEIDALSERFADICTDGGIRVTDPLPPEVSGRDHLDLPRIALRFDKQHWGRFRSLIDAVNGLATAPEVPGGPPLVSEDIIDEDLDDD
jgi:uncharacterized protein (TIGR00730 family)